MIGAQSGVWHDGQSLRSLAVVSKDCRLSLTAPTKLQLILDSLDFAKSVHRGIRLKSEIMRRIKHFREWRLVLDEYIKMRPEAICDMLIEATYGGCIDVCVVLLDRIMLQEGRWQLTCDFALRVAAFVGSLELCQMFVTHGADTSARDTNADYLIGMTTEYKPADEMDTTTYVYTALLFAIDQRHQGVCDYLIGFEISDVSKFKALVLAAEWGNTPLCEKLIDRGARPPPSPDGRWHLDILLTDAVLQGSRQRLELFLELCSQLSLRPSPHVLANAALRGDADMCRLLLDTPNVNLHRLLVDVSMSGHFEICELLCQHGASAYKAIANTHATSSLMRGREDVYAYLVDMAARE